MIASDPAGHESHSAFLWTKTAFEALPEMPIRAFLGLRGAGVLDDGRVAFVKVDDEMQPLLFDVGKRVWKVGARFEGTFESASAAQSRALPGLEKQLDKHVKNLAKHPE